MNKPIRLALLWLGAFLAADAVLYALYLAAPIAIRVSAEAPFIPILAFGVAVVVVAIEIATKDTEGS